MHMPCFQFFTGIDISKQWLDVHRLPDSGTMRFANDPQGLDALCGWLDREAEAGLVVCEPSGGYERRLLARLHQAELPVAMVNARRVRDFARAMGRLAKTDAIDAGLLALYGQRMQPSPMVVPEADATRLAALVARRRQLIDMMVAEKNRLQQALYSELRDDLRDHLALLKTALKETDRRIETLIADCAALAARRAVLTGNPGVGDVTAAVILAELPELGRIEGRRISALAGVAPINRDSGQWRGERHIGGGRISVRCALYMAAIAAIRHNERIRAFYLRHKERGKPTKVAIVAAMHKLLLILNAQMRDHYAQPC